MNRRPAVAGQFYPGRPEDLLRFLQGALATPPGIAPAPALGVIAPHAGYVYSGGVAGAVFARVEVPDTVLLLGPNHTGLGTPASIMSAGSWSTPLGELPIDRDLALSLRDACPLLQEDGEAHRHEHSLEVQLPFLQRRNPDVRIVPVTLMLRDFAEVEELGDAIASVLAERGGGVLLVGSSDMTHYEPSDVAEAKDRLAIERILAIDARGLWDTTRNHRISMCGVIPACVLLVAASRLGVERGELVRYTHSGVTSGDFSRVVGYAGILIPHADSRDVGAGDPGSPTGG